MNPEPGSSSMPLPGWLALVREKVESLSYGVVQIVVHDRKITQIERTERTRIEPAVEPRARRATASISAHRFQPEAPTLTPLDPADPSAGGVHNRHRIHP